MVTHREIKKLEAIQNTLREIEKGNLDKTVLKETIKTIDDLRIVGNENLTLGNFLEKNKVSNYLKNFHIHNDYLHINDQEINNNKKILWQSTLYFKNGYDQNILLFDHLRGKYKIK